jgi:hypothetical protein
MAVIWELTTDTSRIHENTSSVQWVKTAWNDIFSESLVKGFKKFRASKDMNGNQDDALSYKNHKKYPFYSDESGGSDYLAMCLYCFTTIMVLRF